MKPYVVKRADEFLPGEAELISGNSSDDFLMRLAEVERTEPTEEERLKKQQLAIYEGEDGDNYLVFDFALGVRAIGLELTQDRQDAFSRGEISRGELVDSVRRPEGDE